MKKFLILVLCLAMAILPACSKQDADAKGTAQTANNDKTASNYPIVTMEVEKFGTITLELYPDVAPNTVANFVELANKGFYNGLTFHRIISGFMIQGGCPNGDGMGNPGYSIKGEFSANGVKNNLKHTRGVISMARNNISMDSAGSQFFIMHADASYLDGQYAAFGKVIEGMDVVDAIATTPTYASDRPRKEVVIKSVTVDTKGVEYTAEKIG